MYAGIENFVSGDDHGITESPPLERQRCCPWQQDGSVDHVLQVNTAVTIKTILLSRMCHICKLLSCNILCTTVP